VENKMRQILQRNLNRGRVTVSMKITHKDVQEALLNKEIAKAHLKHIKSLKKELKLNGDFSLSDLVKLPGVLDARETFVGPEEIWPILEKCFKMAIKDMVVMRKSEGRSLAGDVTDQLRCMCLKINKIKESSISIQNEKKKKLTIEEFRSFQKSSDVNEEITRLIHYIDEIKLLLKSNDSVGKKIDFVAQEMQRETNTIGSKLQDKEVSNAVIALKSKIEKIREQAQNIE
jgi:uncharacterized protein (TIGR00255 family)